MLSDFVMQTVSANLVVGSHVWVEDPEVAWIDGEILDVDGQEIKISSSSGKVVSVSSVKSVFNTYYIIRVLL